MRLFSWILFCFIIIVEGTFTSLPLTLVFLLCLTVMKRQEWLFPLAFFAGIILDIFAMRQVGMSSLFFLSYIFLILLYQRKYETATMPFVIIASFVGSCLYAFLVGNEAILIVSSVSTIITSIAFALYRSTNRSEIGDTFQTV